VTADEETTHRLSEADLPVMCDGPEEHVMINYIPNDPLAEGDPPMRAVLARPDRKDDQAGFTVFGDELEDQYEVGTSGFLRWQARQAAILALEAWEAVLEDTLTSWVDVLPDPRKLRLVPDGGVDLNAFYDRSSIAFFHDRSGGKTTFSGASTDVVAHEAGHGVLDALRPDLWETPFIEVAGAHEAFGDVTALITALADEETRTMLVAAAPDLGVPNFVEATAEDLSDGILRALGPGHSASKPRRALNAFPWQLPETMPQLGAPDVMIAEVHSIARILTGCFYDLLRGIFTRSSDRSEADLWEATRLAGRLQWIGAARAPEVPRFFRAVGRQMVLADVALTGGENRGLIGGAFAGHGIALGSQALLAPELALAGAAPRFDRAAASAQIDEDTIADLQRRLGVGAAPAEVSMLELAGTPVAKVTFREDVPLDDVDPRLRGVIASAPAGAIVGESGGAAALLHAPRPEAPGEETQHFVRSLIDHQQPKPEPEPEPEPRTGTSRTHIIEEHEGRRAMRRIRFT
jgi:hypothetical protein